MSKDDDEPDELRDFPPMESALVAAKGDRRMVIANTPLGSSSWFDEQWAKQARERYEQLREIERLQSVDTADGIEDGGSYVREAMQTIRDLGVAPEPYASVDNMPDDELRRRSRELVFKPIPPPGIESPFRGFTEWIDRYMEKLARAIQLPASMLIGDRQQTPEQRVDAQRYVRMILLKQWRGRARAWLSLKGPIRRLIRNREAWR